MLLDAATTLSAEYAALRRAAAQDPDAITTLVLVSIDADALATAAMLTRLLENDSISHNVKPVRDYGHLKHIFATSIADSKELRNIVLINCGSNVSLEDELEAELGRIDAERPGGVRSFDEVPDPECRWWVIDSHRPFNVDNAAAGGKICVFGESDNEEGREQLDELLQLRYVMDDADDEEELGHDDDDDDNGDDEPPTQRRRITADEYRRMSPGSRAFQQRQLRQLERAYYATSWYGCASSVLMYQLVKELSRSNNELLWLAAVGLTDQLVHERVVFERYVSEAQRLQEDVAALNQTGNDVIEVRDGETSAIVAQHIASSSGMRLESVQELRLAMLRHWSLYDALRHSSYVATRLGLYTERGRGNLDVLLARMGFPLDECRQEYAYMKPEIRERLHESLHLYGSEFGLMHLTYPSVRRITSYGLGTTVSAADIVYCVDAQLEAVSESFAQHGGADENSASNHPSSADAKARREEQVLQAEDDATSAAFSRALATLTSHTAPRHGGTSLAGIERAKDLLRALISQGNSIITSKAYTRLGDFYKVVMRDSIETELFTHVQALTKLALFVADALREAKALKESLPVLMAAPRIDKKTHLVVGVLGSGRHVRGAGRNPFGKAFASAARDRTIKARVAHESFEASVCIVASDDLQNFVQGVVLNYDG